MKIKTKTVIFFSLIILLWSFLAKAGTIYTETEKENLGIGDTFKLDFLLDTKGKKINAVEGKIILPKNNLKFVQISQEDSIISNWLQPPLFKDSPNNKEILFSGLIPGGYQGEKALILSLILEAEKEGRIEVKMDNIRTLLNDSKGTEIHSVFLEKGFLIASSPSSQTKEDIEKLTRDEKPPFDFDLRIFKSEGTGSKQWFLAFDAKDDKSGISHYLIQENKYSAPDKGGWEKVEKGPYLIKDQSLKKFIFVKAIDKAGNEKLEVIEPSRMKSEFNFFEKNNKYGKIILNILIFAGIIITIGALIFIIKKRNGRQNKK